MTEEERKRVLLKVDKEKKECIVALKILNSLFSDAMYMGEYSSKCLCGHDINHVFTITHKETRRSYDIGSCCITMCKIRSLGKIDENGRYCIYCNKQLSCDNPTTSHKACKQKILLQKCLRAWNSNCVERWPCRGKYEGLSLRTIHRMNPSYFYWVFDEGYMFIPHPEARFMAASFLDTLLYMKKN